MLYNDPAVNAYYTTPLKEEQGLRYDEGKIRWDLMPPDALQEVARVYTRGAQKYADRNWEKGMDWGKCLRALKSHLNKWELGQSKDDELTDCYNMAMVAWNALALLSYELRGIGNDNRAKINVTPLSKIDT